MTGQFICNKNTRKIEWVKGKYVQQVDFVHLMRRAGLFEKPLMLGKIEGERRGG